MYVYIYVYLCVCVSVQGIPCLQAFLSWEVLSLDIALKLLSRGAVFAHRELSCRFTPPFAGRFSWRAGKSHAMEPWLEFYGELASRLAVVCGVVLVGCVQQQGTLKSTMIYQLSSFPAKQMDTKKFFWDNGGKAIVSDCHWVLWPWIYPLVIPVFWWYQLTQFGGFFPHVLPFLDTQRYPLVNIQKTMDNHHFSWENPLFLWLFSIANC